jgi:glycosyltransferase involved in cell wall biosynthesis
VKVLLHTSIDVTLPGGLETHVRELAAGLTARGHAVTIAGRASRPTPLTVVERAAPAEFDVVHDHGGLARAHDGHPGLVRTLHFCVAAKMATYVRIGRLRTLANLANWRAVADERSWARRPGRLIAVAERVRRDFARWHGLDGTRATVISNGFVPAAPLTDRATLRARHGIAETARVLLTIGRDDFVKGYALLGRAWDAARAGHDDALWVTVGGREGSRAPGRLVTGPIPHAEVADWIAAADVGALPSWYEGCSVALLEMLAGGLYSLAQDVGNAPEVIRPRVDGEILAGTDDAWREALTRLLATPPPRASAHLDATYAWPAIVERTEAVYREVCRS